MVIFSVYQIAIVIIIIIILMNAIIIIIIINFRNSEIKQKQKTLLCSMPSNLIRKQTNTHTNTIHNTCFCLKCKKKINFKSLNVIHPFHIHMFIFYTLYNDDDNHIVFVAPPIIIDLLYKKKSNSIFKFHSPYFISNFFLFTITIRTDHHSIQNGLNINVCKLVG